MRRLALTSLAAACVILATPVSLTPSASGASPLKRSDAQVRLVACRPALDPLARRLTVDSLMRSLEDNDRMQMRFDLYQRLPGARRYRRLGGPGLSTWNLATPGVDRFRFRKPIQNLPAPASYYVRVHFRWLNATGRVIARTSRVTGTCAQPDLRPDLRVSGLAGVRRVAVNRFVYRVIVRNAGRSWSSAWPPASGAWSRSPVRAASRAGPRRSRWTRTTGWTSPSSATTSARSSAPRAARAPRSPGVRP
jgi:hypothetical protein